MWIERLAGLEAELAPPHVFSLNSQVLRYARVDRGEDGSVLLGEYLAVPLPSGAFQDGPLGGPLVEPRLLREPLDELLSQTASKPTQATLVLPDRWFRLVLADASDLPRKRSDRAEAIRFKLGNLVPFRVEELRVQSEEFGPSNKRRTLIGFAIDHVLGQLEIQFAAAGITIGRITCESLGLASALERAPGDEQRDEQRDERRDEQRDERRDEQREGLSAQVMVKRDGYTLLFFRDREPLLYRYKVSDPTATVEVANRLAHRELTLTLRYLEGEVPGLSLKRAFVSAPAESAEQWQELFRHGLDVAPVLVGAENLPGGRSVASPWSMPWHEMGPMVGAVLEEVL